MAARPTNAVGSLVGSPQPPGTAVACAPAGALAGFAQLMNALAAVCSGQRPGPTPPQPPTPAVAAPPAERAPGAAARGVIATSCLVVGANPSTGTERSSTTERSATRDGPSTSAKPRTKPAIGDDAGTPADDAVPPIPSDPAAASGDAIVAALPPIVPSIEPPSQAIAGRRTETGPPAAAVGGSDARACSRAGAVALDDGTAAAPAAVVAQKARSDAPLLPVERALAAAAPEASAPLPASAPTGAFAATPPATPPIAEAARPPPAAPLTAAPADAPAMQIAPTLVSVAQSPAGTPLVTIRLDPPELGSVQIRLEHAADASLQVAINVQRPETLALLMRDQPHLEHVLDQAGVPAEGRSLSFQLDPEPQYGTSDQSNGGQGRRAAAPQTAARQMQADAGDPDDPAAGALRWSRMALDITA